jgi:hypothetical protein
MGHKGVEKTLHQLRSDFFVQGAHAAVHDHVRACPTCQKNKSEQLHPAGLLQPLTVPSAIWCDIAMDFVEGLQRVNNKSIILIVVDRLSKYAHFIALGHPYTATSVAQAFFDSIVRQNNNPRSIVNDRDSCSRANFGRSCSNCPAFISI